MRHTESRTQAPFSRTDDPVWLQLFGTVGAIDLLIVADKALVSQIHGTLFTMEAVVMPGLPFIADHTGAFTKACDGVLTSSTFLGNKGLVAIHTVILILHSSEALSSQLLAAGGTHEALAMPGLILVSDSSRSDDLVALHAVLGKLGLMTGNTVEIFTLWEETAGSNDLFAVTASEAILMPDILLVFHILVSCNNLLEAPFAPG